MLGLLSEDAAFLQSSSRRRCGLGVAKEHVAIYRKIIEITRQVDPAVVVGDYTFRLAQRVEDLGVGPFAIRGTAPEWSVNVLADPFLKILDSSEASAGVKKEAGRIGQIARRDPGRYVAAREIFKLVASG